MSQLGLSPKPRMGGDVAGKHTLKGNDRLMSLNAFQECECHGGRQRAIANRAYAPRCKKWAGRKRPTQPAGILRFGQICKGADRRVHITVLTPFSHCRFPNLLLCHSPEPAIVLNPVEQPASPAWKAHWTGFGNMPIWRTRVWTSLTIA